MDEKEMFESKMCILLVRRSSFYRDTCYSKLMNETYVEASCCKRPVLRISFWGETRKIMEKWLRICVQSCVIQFVW